MSTLFTIRPHAEWLALGSDAGECRQRYTEFVAKGLQRKEIDLFHRCSRKGLPAGSDRIRQEIETALATRIGNGQRGRPKKGLQKRALTPFSTHSSDALVCKKGL